MIYAFRIIGHTLMLLVILLLTASRFDDTEQATILCFFFYMVTVESLAAIFDFPFRILRPRKRHG